MSESINESEKGIADAYRKAKLYDELQNELAEFYDENSEHNKDGREADLGDIGEWIATKFGWL